MGRTKAMAAGPVQRICLDDAPALLEAISPWGPYFGDAVMQFTHLPWVFRGQSDSTWPLLPTAIRREAQLLTGEMSKWHRVAPPDSGGVPNHSQAWYELCTLRAFYLLADEQGLPILEDSRQMRENMLHPWDYLNELHRGHSTNCTEGMPRGHPPIYYR